jgi:hypothetical protein
MQQNVVAPVKDRPESRTDGQFVERRKQGKFTWTVKVIRGGPPTADRRVVQPELQRRI